jgi:predicted MFS family arabinose efflux permease
MPRASSATHSGGGVGAWRAIIAGLCASLVGIGLARFAYTPLIPALIAAGWFAPAEAAYLGAANLAGYLAGALLARRMARHATAGFVLRANMLLASVAFFACAAPLPFWWFFIWRFAAGVAGGALMVLAAPTVLAHVPPARHGLAGGAIFTGVGLGIAASGTLVPLLLRAGLGATWCGVGALALVLTILAWAGWPAERTRASAPPALEGQHRARFGPALKALYVEYALNAVALVPHMVFLVDFVARGLARGIEVGSYYWVLFGLGAVTGPLITGHIADRIGFARALRLAFLVQAAAVALPAITVGPGALVLSSLVVGAMVPGVVPLVLGRVHELTPHDDQERQAGWSFATAAFALGQAAAAYGFSFLFARTGGGYAALFALGAAALLLALVIDLAAAALGRRAQLSEPKS